CATTWILPMRTPLNQVTSMAFGPLVPYRRSHDAASTGTTVAHPEPVGWSGTASFAGAHAHWGAGWSARSAAGMSLKCASRPPSDASGIHSESPAVTTGAGDFGRTATTGPGSSSYTNVLSITTSPDASTRPTCTWHVPATVPRITRLTD